MDLPLAMDHFFPGSVIRAEFGDILDLDANTVSMGIHEPLDVVGQIIPWNFPIPMAGWKVARCPGCRELCRAETGRADAGFDSIFDQGDRCKHHSLNVPKTVLKPRVT